MAKHDAKGKSKKHFNGSFVGLEYGVMQSPAYRSLSGDSLKLFLDLWTRFSTKDGNNNGHISYSVREAADLLQSGKDKARRCFVELIDRGFLAIERKGAFSVKMKLATTWRITLLATASAAPTRDYQRWRPTPVTVPNTGTENSTEIQNTVPTLRRVGTQNRYRGTKKQPKTAPTVPSTGTETTPNEGLSVPRTGTHLDICHRHSEASTAVSGAVRGVLRPDWSDEIVRDPERVFNDIYACLKRGDAATEEFVTALAIIERLERGRPLGNRAGQELEYCRKRAA